MRERVSQFITTFTKDKLAKKYLSTVVWTSGCQTEVRGITVFRQEIILQWTCDKNIFNKWIARIVNSNTDIIEDGMFWKSDGSCPSTITFTLKEPV